MNDVEFYSLPCERQEQIMWMEGTPLTRQTIETYIQRLADNELILRASGNFRYYFALGDTIIDTDEETYKQAWHEYWIHIELCRRKMRSGRCAENMVAWQENRQSRNKMYFTSTHGIR